MDSFYALVLVTALLGCVAGLFRIHSELRAINGRLLTIAEFFQLWIRSTSETDDDDKVIPLAQVLRQLSNSAQEGGLSLRKIASEAEGQTIALQAIGEAVRTHLPDYRGPLKEMIEQRVKREGREP